VHCGQTVGWIKMKLGMQVGLGPGYTVLDEDHLPFPQRGTVPQFSAHICCGQMVGSITYGGLWPGYIVLDGDPAPPRKGAGIAALHFSANCSGMVAHLSNC